MSLIRNTFIYLIILFFGLTSFGNSQEVKKLGNSFDEQTTFSRKNEKSCHWANRQFYEYFDAA